MQSSLCSHALSLLLYNSPLLPHAQTSLKQTQLHGATRSQTEPSLEALRETRQPRNISMPESMAQASHNHTHLLHWPSLLHFHSSLRFSWALALSLEGNSRPRWTLCDRASQSFSHAAAAGRKEKEASTGTSNCCLNGQCHFLLWPLEDHFSCVSHVGKNRLVRKFLSCFTFSTK